MQYRLLPLHLASLYPQHHYIWCSTDYFPYSWHHCSLITTSDAVPVTSLTVGITVPTTAVHLMQYWLHPLQLASLYPNNTTSDAVPVTSLTGGITVPTKLLALIQYRLLATQLASLYLQQHQLWCSTATCQQMSSSSTNILKSLGLFSHLQT